MKKGKLLEQITSIIEETTQGNDLVKIFQDVQLIDKYGNSRQIDVLIEYKQNERFTFKTIIECKYKGRDGVEVNQMTAFLGTLESLPDIHQGIFVSTSGFQKAAKNVANSNNILMYTLEEISKMEIKKWFDKPPSIKQSEKGFEIKNWRILVDKKDEQILQNLPSLEIDPEQVLEKDSTKISIRSIISAIVPWLTNREFNKLLEKSWYGEDIIGKKFNQTFLIPLQNEFLLKSGGIEVPMKYLEIELEYWIKYSEELFATYNIYKDQDEKELSRVILGKVKFQKKDMLLSLVHDFNTNKSEVYLIDGEKQRLKLEIDKEIYIPETKRTHFIMKHPKS